MRRLVSRALLAAFVAIAALGGASAQAQGVQPGAPAIAGRTLVLVPPLNGPQGPRVAALLRGLITDDDKFVALDDRAVKSTMAQYSVTALDSVTARQLAALSVLGSQLVSWGTVTQEGRAFSARVLFTDIKSGDEASVNVTGANPNELAAAIFAGFKERMAGMELVGTCTTQVAASQFQQALSSCDQALASAPNSAGALLGRARSLYGLERYPDALTAFNRLLELDPSSQDALLGAGLSASRANQSAQAMTFYNRHVELNGNTTEARRFVAGEILKVTPTPDVVAGYRVLEPAAVANRSDIEFQKSFFQVAVAAGTGAKTAARTAADSTAADQMLIASLAAYDAAFPAGAGLDVQNLLRAVTAAVSLKRTEDALRLAREGTEKFPTDAQVWSLYAALLHDNNQPVESIAALTRLITIDPAFTGGYLRRGQAYLESLQMDLAIADFRNAARNGDGDRVAQQLLNMASPYLQPMSANYVEAERLLTPALEFATSAELKSNVSFYLGYAIYLQGDAAMKAAKPTDIAAYRGVLALWQKALPYIEGSTHANAVSMAGPLKGGIDQLTNSLRGR